MKKVVFSIYLEEDLRRRLLDLASKRQTERGRRVSINSIVVTAIETYLDTIAIDAREWEAPVGEPPSEDPPKSQTQGYIDVIKKSRLPPDG